MADHQFCAEELERKDARIAQLEAALNAYGKHQFGCGRVGAPMPPPAQWMTNLELEAWQRAQPCTCGLDSALETKPKLEYTGKYSDGTSRYETREEASTIKSETKDE